MTFNKSLLLYLLFNLLVFTNFTNAQVNISGLVTDINGEGLPFANVIILNAEDSIMISGDLSNENGEYQLESKLENDFLIQLSYLGYETYTSSIIKLDVGDDYEHESIALAEGIALNEVNIVAKKPLFEQAIDRMVINVSNSVTAAGGSALEILEKSPGVLVNRQSNAISMIGKEGVVLMINDKVSYQPAESIVQMLEGMNAENIESIELITTPPSNFDAEGNAGFINIKLKKRTDLGLNGFYSASLGYGLKSLGNGSLNLNYRRDRVNIFSNYSHSNRGTKQDFFNTRIVQYQNQETESSLWTDRDSRQINHQLSLGLDIQLSDKTIVGFLSSAYSNKWEMSANNKDKTLVDQILEESTSTINTEVNHWEHWMANVNVEHKISEGQTIKFNADYLEYVDNNPNEYFTEYFDQDLTSSRSEQTRSSKYTPITIKVAQIDYENKINDKLKLTLGSKSALSQFNNDVGASILVSDDWQQIDQFTNNSMLDEMIMAGYGNLDWKLDTDNSFKLGLRYEYTDSKLNTVKDGIVVDRQFGKFFPSIFYSRNLNEQSSVNLSYTKRITRPTFNQMAPFAIFLSPTTFFFGNASIQPAIADNYKIAYRYKSYLLSVQYAVEDSTISNFQNRVDITTNQQSWEPVNLSETKNISTTLSVPIYIGNNWQMQNNFSLLMLESKSYYDNTLINIDQTSYNISSTQSFILGKDYSFELNGFYNSASYFGRSLLKPYYRISAGFQKKFKDGGNLRFNVRDIFDSMEWQTSVSIPEAGFATNGIFDFSNRTFTISYSNSFGNQKVKAKRNRITGSESERKRIQ